jgi:magnesium transporter
MPPIQQVKFKSFVWINIPEPSVDDIEILRKKYAFHALDLEDCLSENERPKVEENDKYLFVLLHFPVFDKRTKSYSYEEINFFLGKNFLVTLNGERLDVMQDIFNECKNSVKSRKEFMAKGVGYLLYRLISRQFDEIFPYVDRINSNVRSLETAVFESTSSARGLLYEIMILKRQVINLRRIILPHRSVMVVLEDKAKYFLTDSLEAYFDDVVDKIERLWSNLEGTKEFLGSLQETNESIISHNTNNVMKTLTVISVIMLPLTFITGLFGMNVNLPYATADGSFVSIIIAMLVIVFAMVAAFKLKKWL